MLDFTVSVFGQLHDKWFVLFDRDYAGSCGHEQQGFTHVTYFERKVI